MFDYAVNLYGISPKKMRYQKRTALKLHNLFIKNGFDETNLFIGENGSMVVVGYKDNDFSIEVTINHDKDFDMYIESKKAKVLYIQNFSWNDLKDIIENTRKFTPYV
jgi:hypothetical protein